MRLTSSAFLDGQAIPIQYTADGEEHSPPLEFREVPASAASLALVMEDPDIPRDRRPSGMFDHWILWNLPATISGLSRNQDPPGCVGRTTYGTDCYVGPAPPTGEHRYYFYLYALDTMLDIPAGSDKATLFDAMTGHVLSVARLEGRYARPEERREGA